jgi:hypothetical protein
MLGCHGGIFYSSRDRPEDLRRSIDIQESIDFIRWMLAMSPILSDSVHFLLHVVPDSNALTSDGFRSSISV